MRRLSLLFVLLLASMLSAAQSHFLKDITIDQDRVVEGDLSVYRGDLLLQGTVQGNVAVMFGNCVLSEGATVEGDLVVMQGGLKLHHRNQVKGRVSHKGLGLDGDSGEEGPFLGEAAPLEDVESDDEAQEWEEDDTDLFVSVNRVAGLRIGLRFTKDQTRMPKDKLFDLTGFGAWAFAESRAEWDIKLRRNLLKEPNLYLGIGIHRKTSTQDAWMIESNVNSLSCVFLHIDYRDYYDSQGGKAELGGFFMDGKLHVASSYFREEYGPMSRNTQWSWSGADRNYRDNLFSEDLGMFEEDNQGIRLNSDLRLGKSGPNHAGMHLTVNYEKSLNTDEHVWEYDRYLGNFRFWLPIGKKHLEQFSGRVLAGTVDGSAPMPYMFRLGGPGTLPGYRSKSIDGYHDNSVDDRIESAILNPDTGEALGAPNMLLLSLENSIKGSALRFWPLDDLDFFVAANAGQIWQGSWADLEGDTFHADVGFGFGGLDADEDWRFGIFRSTESGEADWRLMFRLNHWF